jgi:hypothetical protein
LNGADDAALAALGFATVSFSDDFDAARNRAVALILIHSAHAADD